MDIQKLKDDASAFLSNHPMNRVTADDAMRDDLVGLRLYDAPIFAVGDAADPLFETLRQPDVVHPAYMPPREWLAEARSVVTFFLPFSERVKRANAADLRGPVDEWMHARIEGEETMNQMRAFVRDWFIAAGFAAVAPPLDARMAMLAPYAANWSERHTAFVCGLGTFGLSKGLITEKGVAGRFGSVVTVCPLPVTARAYKGVYDYCTKCGACARNCPIHCIDGARGDHEAKAHPPCETFVGAMRALPPNGKSAKRRYGCGKCQVAVPCQDRIPARAFHEA